MKKIIGLLLVVLSVSINSNIFFATGVASLNQNLPNGNLFVDATGTHFILADGTFAVNKWVKVLDKFMYFDSAGNQTIYNKINGEIILGVDGLTFAHKPYAGNILEPTSTVDGSMLAEQLAAKTLDSQLLPRKRLISKLTNNDYVVKETGRQSAYTLEEVENAVDNRLKADWNYVAFMSGTLYYLENEVQLNRDSLQGGDIYEYLLARGFTKNQADKASDKVLENIYDVEEIGKEKKSYGTNQNDNFINGWLN